MLAMCDAPRVIGNEKKRMANRTNGVINYAIIAESLVAALVGNHPNSCHDTSLSIPIQAPQWVVQQRSRRSRGDEASQVEQDRNLDKIHDEVSEAEEKRPLEAVFGNSVLDGLEGELGRRKGQISWTKWI